MAEVFGLPRGGLRALLRNAGLHLGDDAPPGEVLQCVLEEIVVRLPQFRREAEISRVRSDIELKPGAGPWQVAVGNRAVARKLFEREARQWAALLSGTPMLMTSDVAIEDWGLATRARDGWYEAGMEPKAESAQ